VEFIEEEMVGRQFLLHKLLKCWVRHPGRHKFVTRQDAPRVSIRHKEGLTTGVKQNGVYRLRPQTWEPQQLTTKLSRRTREHGSQ
jgi:hypothetical protein